VAAANARLDFERQVMTLASAGLSRRQIAQRLGCSAGWVQKVIKRALTSSPAPHVTEFRASMLARYELMLTPWYLRALGTPAAPGQPAKDPTPEAARIVLAISAEETKLMGAYAPQQLEVGGGVALDVTVEGLSEALNLDPPTAHA
jgi:hypothetical protein